jgi:hypothetical protein
MYLAQGLALFQQLKDTKGIPSVLLDWARVASAQGHDSRAQTYYAESLAQFREYIDKQRIPDCIDGLAGLARATGQPARAARLFGAAEALRESAGIPLPPVYRAAYEHALAAVRAQLDEAAFAASWAAGQALSLEQAITEALDATNERPIDRTTENVNAVVR